MIKRILLFIPLAMLFVACSSTKNLEQLNLAHLYQEDGVVLKPLFKVYHVDATTTRVYFQGSSDQLLYVKETGANDYIARIGIRYTLYSDYQRTAVIDSGSTLLTDIQESPKTSIILGHFDLALKSQSHNNKYLLEVILVDKNRNLTYMDLIPVDKSDIQSRQNFLHTTQKGRVIFQNHYPVGVPFLLTHNDNPKKYIVRYYNRDFPLAATPYAKNEEASFKYKADSVFEVFASDTLVLQKHGFYHFQINDLNKEGFTLFSFYNEFPLITRKQNLGPPLRYLTTKEEYAEISKPDDQEMKLAVDKFWLKMSGTVDRGKMLVSEYYGRVENANLYFTSYLEGWKTDRGIIYVVLGPPTEVTRNEYQEMWVYGDPHSSLNYVFTFTKLKNPFSDNDYALNRSSSYRYGWAQAIESWRNGQIYSIKEIKQAQDERDRQSRINNTPYFWY
jgi:GWxTD domain-containing protein